MAAPMTAHTRNAEALGERGSRSLRRRGGLGERAGVIGRDDAIAEGWFGPVDDRVLGRIGDVIVAPAGPYAIVATKAEPRESALIGLHGSLTQSDQLIPLLTVTVG